MALLVQEELDQHITSYRKHISVQYDRTINALCIETKYLDEAIYIWLILDLLSAHPVKECLMCGALFIPTNNLQKYCSRHTVNQVQYFKSKLKANKQLNVHFQFEPTESVWVATSNDIDIELEAESFNELIDQIKSVVPGHFIKTNDQDNVG